MPRFVSVDRFEGELAVVVEDGAERRLPRSSLPSLTREGDVVNLDTGQVDEAETTRLQERVRAARAEAMKARPGPAGDFDL